LVTVGSAELAPIRPDQDGELFDLFARIVASGEGFPHAPPLTRAQFDDTWVRPVTTVVAATVDGVLAGAYYLKPNSPGRAAHIANAGYLVSPEHRGLGIGRALVADSITRAPELGFDAIQFNLVFESNPARALYEELGWREIGRIPDAVEGETALIYWRAV
jgi:GNAT superfamily N-acetyltransferase